MDRIPIWKRQIPQRGRVSAFQIIAAMLTLAAASAAWYWRTQISGVPQYLVPGLFVAVLGLVAVAITLRPPMSKGEKIFWILIATTLCVCEVIVLESAARCQLEQFNQIMNSFKTLTAITGDMNANMIRFSNRAIVVNPPAVIVKPQVQLQRETFGNLYQRLLELSQDMLQMALTHQNAINGPKPYSREWLEWNAVTFQLNFEKRLDDIVAECKSKDIEDTMLNNEIKIVKMGLRPRPDGTGHMGIWEYRQRI